MIPIVYLHGFASSPQSTKARHFREKLEAAGARVSVPDLARGDFERLTISGQLSVLDQIGGRHSLNLVGSSMGGYLAALYGSRHPEVERLVLLAPAFRFHRRWVERLGQAALDRWKQTNSVEVYHYGDGCTRPLAYDLMEDASHYEDFPDFRQPALLFHGRQDDIVPVEYSEEFARSHPNVTLEVLDSGHDLLDVVDHISKRTVNFLLKKEKGGAG